MTTDLSKVTNEQRRQIIEILTYFNFSRVAKVMEALEWEWGCPGEVPSMPEIIAEATRILEDVCELPDGSSLSCGGFVATQNEGFLGLRFQVEDWYCCEEDSD